MTDAELRFHYSQTVRDLRTEICRATTRYADHRDSLHAMARCLDRLEAEMRARGMEV